MHKGDSPEAYGRERGYDMKDPYEVLGVSADSSISEVEVAYRELLKVFDPKSPGLSALWSKEQIEALRHEIEEAYLAIKQKKQEEKKKRSSKTIPQTSEAPTVQHEVLSGGLLRELRQKMGLSLQEVADKIKVRPSILKAIEEESLKDLPPWIYVKGFLKLYAKFLGLDPAEVIKAFEPFFQESRDKR